jgi:hypothetical protein
MVGRLQIFCVQGDPLSTVVIGVTSVCPEAEILTTSSTPCSCKQGILVHTNVFCFFSHNPSLKQYQWQGHCQMVYEGMLHDCNADPGLPA